MKPKIQKENIKIFREGNFKNEEMATLRQKKVFDKVMEKVGKGETPAISREMQGVYSPHFSRQPGRLINSKGWEELMEKNFPDKFLAERHRELLNKRDRLNGEDLGPETQAVSKGLDMAYKLKKRYPDDGSGENKTLILVVSGESAQRFNVQPDRITKDNST